MMEFKNAKSSRPRVHLFQGEFVVSSDPEYVVTTILGSCVAACIRDPIARIGGMNHFLLPGVLEPSASDSRIVGVHLMELLINGLLSRGAQRDRLEAKLFGGARTVEGLMDIGAQNVEFAMSFLKREGITVNRGSVGGTLGRRIEFWPAQGRVRQNFAGAGAVVSQPARPVTTCIKPDAGEVELF